MAGICGVDIHNTVIFYYLKSLKLIKHSNNTSIISHCKLSAFGLKQPSKYDMKKVIYFWSMLCTCHIINWRIWSKINLIISCLKMFPDLNLPFSQNTFIFKLQNVSLADVCISLSLSLSLSVSLSFNPLVSLISACV